jgi:hypothetical protein
MLSGVRLGVGGCCAEKILVAEIPQSLALVIPSFASKL